MTKQYMKYIPTGGVELEINKELEKGSKVLLMIPFLQTDFKSSYTAGYYVLFEKVDEKKWRKLLEDEIAKKDDAIKSLKAELDIKAEIWQREKEIEFLKEVSIRRETEIN